MSAGMPKFKAVLSRIAKSNTGEGFSEQELEMARAVALAIAEELDRRADEAYAASSQEWRNRDELIGAGYANRSAATEIRAWAGLPKKERP